MWDRDEERAKVRPITALISAAPTAPPYGQRRGWIPRRTEVSIQLVTYYYLLKSDPFFIGRGILRQV